MIRNNVSTPNSIGYTIAVYAKVKGWRAHCPYRYIHLVTSDTLMFGH